MRSIYKAYENNFAVDSNGKVIGSEGICCADWKYEWQKLFRVFEIEYSDVILKELTLCVISLAQNTVFKLNGNSGTLEVFFDDMFNIDLCYRINTPGSYFVTFLKSGQWVFSDDHPRGIVDKPILTTRDNGELKVKCEGQFIALGIGPDR